MYRALLYYRQLQLRGTHMRQLTGEDTQDTKAAKATFCRYHADADGSNWELLSKNGEIKKQQDENASGDGVPDEIIFGYTLDKCCNGVPVQTGAETILARNPQGQCQLTSTAGVGGDPHLKTWTGRRYDFHGECDLVLMHSNNFGGGLGLDIHIRTEIKQDWSFVAATAIKIGQDILEIGSAGHYYLNGLKSTALTLNKATISGFRIIYKQGGDQNDYRFIVDMGIKGKVRVKVHGEYLAVSVSQAKEEYFGDAVGLMGEFQTGNMIGRDGATTSFEQDPNAFGFDWQVRDTEIKLFRESKGPQHPIQCKMPDVTSDKRRRLEESVVSRADAEQACADFEDEADKEDCIFDVIATGDLGIAQAGAF